MHSLDGLTFTIDEADILFCDHEACPIGEKIYDITGYTGRCEIGSNPTSTGVYTNIGLKMVVSDIFPEDLAHALCLEHFLANDAYFMDDSDDELDGDAWESADDRLRNKYLGPIVEKFAGSKFTLRARE